jgi:hypothetical protein
LFIVLGAEPVADVFGEDADDLGSALLLRVVDGDEVAVLGDDPGALLVDEDGFAPSPDEVVVVAARFPPLDDTEVVGVVPDPGPVVVVELPLLADGEVGPGVFTPALDEEVSVLLVLVLSACATPEPLASAAPSPSVTAPAPSHRYGSV